MRRVLRIVAVNVVALALILVGAAWFMLVPRAEDNPLPPGLVALDSTEGQALLERSIRADHDALVPHFAPQIYTSYCGVASSAAALRTLGITTDQDAFFTDAAEDVQSGFATLTGGMTLPTLAGLLGAHGARVEARHGDTFDVDALRDLLRDDLARPGDVVLINYERAGVGQTPGGHISPVVAYDPETDRALIYDTAAHRYPPVWVELSLMHAAMRTIDPDSGAHRGLVRVGPPRPAPSH